MIEWKACAIGKNMETAKTFLEKNYDANMLLEEATTAALKGLKEGFQGINMNIQIIERSNE
jgi:20S proteasome subunit alpha 2